MPSNKFNSGKPYHGSPAVQNGKLTGATDQTDYFYFFCPKCSGKQIMRILEYGVQEETEENRYNSEFGRKAKHGFMLAFKLCCESCKHSDFVKISNRGWQQGDLNAALGEPAT